MILLYFLRLNAETGELRYEVIDGRGSLYFSGGRAFAEVPAVPFTSKEFTILLWVRIDQQLVNNPTMYSGNKNPCSFLLWFVKQKKSIRFAITPASSSLFKTGYIRFVWYLHYHGYLENKVIPQVAQAQYLSICLQWNSGEFLVLQILR
jgi:hypothetical protein